MKKIIALLMLGLLLATGTASLAQESSATVDSDGWIHQDLKNTPPDVITYTPDIKPGSGTWLNPHAKGNDPNKIYIEVNGSTLYPDVDPFQDENDRVIAPVRFITEAINSTVTWDSTDGQGRVDITRKGKTVQLWIGKNTAKIDNQEVQMDTIAVLRNNRTMVPVRFINEAFGAEVLWSEPDRRVFITLIN